MPALRNIDLCCPKTINLCSWIMSFFVPLIILSHSEFFVIFRWSVDISIHVTALQFTIHVYQLICMWFWGSLHSYPISVMVWNCKFHSIFGLQKLQGWLSSSYLSYCVNSVEIHGILKFILWKRHTFNFTWGQFGPSVLSLPASLCPCASNLSLSACLPMEAKTTKSKQKNAEHLG